MIDADVKFKKMKNKVTRKFSESDIEERVVGKPSSVKHEKLFIIEERRFVRPRTWEWDRYAEKGQIIPHWTKWVKYQSYIKKNARNSALEKIIKEHREHTKPQKYGYAYLAEEKEYRAVDLKTKQNKQKK